MRQAVAGAFKFRAEASAAPLPAISATPLPDPPRGRGAKRTRRGQQEDNAIQSLMPNPTAECIEAALAKITWPECDSRKGVMPEGVASVTAFVMGLGQYSGGELWVYDPSGNVRIKVERRIRGAPWAKPDSEIPGSLVDIKGKLVAFNGKLPHMVFVSD